MSLARSLYTGVTGLTSHQAMLDVIGDNIANVNTNGFKKSTVSFSTMFSQTLAGPVAPDSTFGGTNAISVGLGSTVSKTNQIFSQGTLQTTSRREDFAISGRGFFAVSDGSTNEVLYTRDGSFSLTAAPSQSDPEYATEDGPYRQYLVTANGQFVMGKLFETGTTKENLPAAEATDKIYIPLGKPISGAQTTVVDNSGQLSSTGTVAAVAGILSSEDLEDVNASNLDAQKKISLDTKLVDLRRKTSTSTALFTAGSTYELAANVGGRSTVTYELPVDAGTTVGDLLRLYQKVMNVTDTANGDASFEFGSTVTASADTSTIQDNALIGKDVDTYKGQRISVRDASGAVFSRVITGLDNITGTLSMDSPISSLAAGDEYTIVGNNSTFVNVASGITASTVLEDNQTAGTFHAQITDTTLIGLNEADVLGKHVKIMQGDAAGNVDVEANIVGYDSATGTILLDKAATLANFPGGLASRVSISIQDDYSVPTLGSTDSPSWVTFGKDNDGNWQSQISFFGNMGSSFNISDVTMHKVGDSSNIMSFSQVSTATGTSLFNTATIYDTGGNAVTLNTTYYLEKTTSNSYVYHYMITSPDVSLKTSDGTPINPDQVVDEGQITFNYDGSLDHVQSFINGSQSADGHVSMPVPRSGYSNGVSTFNVSVAFNHLKAIDVDQATVQMTQSGGYKAGNLTDYSVGQDGLITGVYSNGLTQLLGQIPIVQFRNEEGLIQIGDNLYEETLNAGDRMVVAAGSSSAQTENGLAPTINQRQLEGSNVDLAKEFTDLIVAQRGYQANARTVTVTNQILQELLELI